MEKLPFSERKCNDFDEDDSENDEFLEDFLKDFEGD